MPDAETPNGWTRSTLRRMREGCKRAVQAWGFKAATLQLAEAARREWAQDWAAAVRKHRAHMRQRQEEGFEGPQKLAVHGRRSELIAKSRFPSQAGAFSGSPMLPRECTCGHGCFRWLTESWSVWVETAATFLAIVC